MENNNIHINYLKYVNFKIFSLFRDRLTPVINSYRSKKDKKDMLYQHIFLAPSQLGKSRSFKVRGINYPFVAIWPNTSYQYNEPFYSRSVLPRDFYYKNKDNEVVPIRGFLYDLKVGFELSVGSYIRDFIDQVNLDLIEFDRLRYFYVSLEEILPNLKTRIELLPKSNPLVAEFGENRGFSLVNQYDVSITLPIFHNPEIIERLSIYLNDNLIWSSAEKEG